MATRMTVVQDEYLSEYGGRIPAGSAVEVPDEVAEKWERMGIATPSKKSDQTAREARRAELEAQLAALDEEEASGGSYRSMMRRGPGHGEAPRQQRGRRGAAARRDLDGAEVANEEEADPSEQDEE